MFLIERASAAAAVVSEAQQYLQARGKLLAGEELSNAEKDLVVEAHKELKHEGKRCLPTEVFGVPVQGFSSLPKSECHTFPHNLPSR